MWATATLCHPHTDLVVLEAAAFEVDSGLEEAVVSRAAKGHERTEKTVTDGKDIERTDN